MTKFRPPAIPVGLKTQMGRISQLLYPHASKPNVTVIFILLISLVLAVHALTQAAHGQAEITEPCTADNITRVAAGNECLVIKTYGEPAKRTSLVIFIHGDGYRRDPADYGPSDYMYQAARKHAAKGVVAVGLIRPGYFDSKGNSSTGNSYRSGDNYRPDVIAALGAAVETLKKHYKADTVVLVGHSGGAAISGVILGKYPGLVDAAVLGACPCNIPEWRMLNRGHNNWTRSLSPHDYIDKTDKNIKVIAITGAEDGNTKSILAQNYIASLKEKEIDASFIEVPEVGHNGVVKTTEFETAINEILEAQQ